MGEFEADADELMAAETRELRAGGRECKIEEEAVSEELKEFVRAEIEREAGKLGLPVGEYSEKKTAGSCLKEGKR